MCTKLTMVMILQYKHISNQKKKKSAGLHPLDGFRDSLRPMMLTRSLKSLHLRESQAKENFL